MVVLREQLPYLSLLPLALPMQLLVLLLHLGPDSAVLEQLPLNALLSLRQGLQVDEHVLVVCAQLLHLLLLHSYSVLQGGHLVVLLLYDQAHLLCLRLQVNQSLFCVTQLLADRIRHIGVAFEHLGKLHLGLSLLRLHLVLQALHGFIAVLQLLLCLLQVEILLQLALLQLLVLHEQVLHLLVQLLQHHLILRDHELDLFISCLFVDHFHLNDLLFNCLVLP